jgi:hypothetical protein
VLAGDSRQASLVGAGLMPDKTHTALVGLRVRTYAAQALLSISGVGGVLIRQRSVPANTTMDFLEVINPTNEGAIQISVVSGSADFAVVPAGWFADGSALSVADLPAPTLASGSGPSTVTLPAGVSDSSAAFIALELKPAKKASGSVTVWSTGAAQPTEPTLSTVVAGQIAKEVIPLLPGTGGQLSVAVSPGSQWLIIVNAWSSPPPPVNVPTDNTVVAAPADVAVTSTGTDGTPSTLTYSGAATIQPGDILSVPDSAGTPGGVLELVTSVTPTGLGVPAGSSGSASYTVAVTPAALVDAVPSGDFDQTTPTDSGVPDPIVDPPPLPPDPPPVPSAAAHHTSSPNPTAGTGGHLPGGATFNCSGGIQAQVNSSLRLTGDVNLNASWTPWSGVRAHFGVNAGLAGSINAFVSASASCTGNVTLQGPTLPPISFALGPIPVTVQPVLTMDVSISGSLSGSLSASASVNMGVNAGVDYANGSYSPYYSPYFNASASAQARANAHAEIDVTPKLTFKLYNVAGPYIALTAFASADANLGANPWWTVDAGLRTQVGLALDAWKIHAHFDGPNVEFLRQRVAQASGGYPGPVPGPGGLPNATQGQGYDAAIGAGGGVAPYNFYLVSGAPPPGLSLRSDGHVVGTPSSTGTWGFVVRVIDASGNRSGSDRSVSITVVPAPPPGKWVSVTKGTQHNVTGCSSTYCHWMTVSFGNFAGGSHTVNCYDDMDSSAFYTYSTSSTTSNVCVFGYPGHAVWATVDGVRSPNYTW